MDPDGTAPGGSMEASNVVTDAGVANLPEYARNEGNAGLQAVPSEQAPESEDPGQAAQPTQTRQQPPRYEDPRFNYNMSGDKHLIIFNHYQYEKWREKYILRPTIRRGTYQDVANLERTFHNLEFEVRIYNDYTCSEIKDVLTNFCKENHRNTSCVAVAMMTHGLDTHVCASDALCPVADIIDIVRTAPRLADKPKLFFIQACREKHIHRPTQQNEEVKIPMGADCLVIYSTYEDYVSYRNQATGSWLMQALCEVINQERYTMDLWQMVTLVNKKVARNDAGLRGGKQMSVAEMDLKKFLKFY